MIQGHNSVDRGELESLIERLVSLETEKRETTGIIKDLCQEAKSAGFEPKVLRRLVRERMMDASAKARRDQEDELYAVYCRALGKF